MKMRLTRIQYQILITFKGILMKKKEDNQYIRKENQKFQQIIKRIKIMNKNSK